MVAPKMPARSSLTSSFSITDSNNEVVCPLRNQDGTSCRKRCVGEKRYRSMQEHIRRAHPENYISKLPATEESFRLMIGTATAPTDRQQGPPAPRSHHDHASSAASANPNAPPDGSSSSPSSFSLLPGHNVAGAAAALAQLHSHKIEGGWDSEADWHSDTESGRIPPRSSIELPPIHLTNVDAHTTSPLPRIDPGRDKGLLPGLFSHSPPGRSSTLPPLHRSIGPSRPRKQSITKSRHQRKKSRGLGSDWLRRLPPDAHNDLLRPDISERKALSAEPSANYGKRWEDLIDAAASATEDIDEDRTPSPVSLHRASLPPLSHMHHHSHHPPHPPHSYQASPLQQALTPPSYHPEAPEPFPSVESGESGDNFHIEARGLSDSSPAFSRQNIQIYCAACRGLSAIQESYACTECISGLCQACVDVLISEQGAQRKCPRCATIGGRFKPIQLDVR